MTQAITDDERKRRSKAWHSGDGLDALRAVGTLAVLMMSALLLIVLIAVPDTVLDLYAKITAGLVSSVFALALLVLLHTVIPSAKQVLRMLAME